MTRANVREPGTQADALVIRSARCSLVFALMAALLLAGGSAWALTPDAQSVLAPATVYPSDYALNLNAGSPLALTVVAERPDPMAANAPAASRIYGSQMTLALNSASSLASSVYFGRSLPLYEALRQDNGIGGLGADSGLLALRGTGAEHVAARSRAVQQKLTYASGGLRLQGSYLDVDPAFQVPNSGSVAVIGDRTPADALAALRGMSELQFQAQYSPSAALSLTTSRRNFRNEQPGHQQLGMQVAEVAHALAYQLRGGRQLKAEYQSRDEEWRGHGPINMERLAAHFDVTSRLALDYSYDWNNVQREGHKENGRSVTEVKQSLVYNLTGDNRLSINYRRFDEQWAGKGPMQLETLAASLNPTSRLQLTYSHDWSANDRQGDRERGLTRDVVRRGLTYQLSDRTRLAINYDDTREEWNRDGGLEVTEKQVRDYALSHAFSAATTVNLARNFASVRSGATTTDIETTQLHLEHKPGPRLNLALDWMDRSRSDGSAEDLTQVALESALGAGRGRTALSALYKRHRDGASESQVDTLHRVGLSIAPTPLLQLNANYEALRQQGPQANHDFVRTNLALTSQLHRFARLTANYARETDQQVQTRADRGLRLEVNPGWLTLNAALAMQERQGQADLTTACADFQFKLGQPLADWAKAASAAEPTPGASGYGFRTAPAWAGLGDGALTLNYIGRSTDGQPHVVTRVIGYQTMLGSRAYLRLALHNNPMVKRDNQMVMESVRREAYEGGVDLGGGFVTVARFIREQDFSSGAESGTRVFGMRGAVGGRDLLTFVAGLQTMEPQGGARSSWQFGNLKLRFGRLLAEWAASASNTGLFDDSVKYGYRQLPGWVSFSDGGLSLHYLSRESESGERLIASAAGYQTMLGADTYLRLSLQHNPLNDKRQVVLVDRELYEVGRRFGARFVALARYVTEDNLGEARSLRSSMLAFRGRLSARERVETVVVLDDVTSQGARYRTTTYGLEYAREVAEGHYLVLKGTYTDDDPARQYLRDSYQVDFAYKKAI